MDARFRALKTLKAGEFQHLNGDLESHLKATARILEKWGAPEILQTAGLFHAAYGTAGFSQNMVSLNQRHSISNIIGEKEEELVYLYCACDRSFVFPQFGNNKRISFRDRFTESTFPLKDNDASMFCELTVANELELVYSSDSFKFEHGENLYKLFSRMEVFLPNAAVKAFKDAFAEFT
ncbi:MAG: DUF6817 domain-containing protein [Pseudomonadota bacterium]